MSVEYEESIHIAAHPDGEHVVRMPSLLFHGCGACGRTFEGIATVIEPDSENPGLLLPRPLGFNMVREILEVVEDRRQIKADIETPD